MVWVVHLNVETIFETGEYVIATQKDFYAHFGLRRNSAVPGRIFNS